MQMHKKLLSIAVAIGLMCGLCGCFSSALFAQLTKDLPPDPDAYLPEFKNNWCYRYLDDDLKDCYGSLYTALTDGFSQDQSVTFQENESDKTLNGISITLPHNLPDQTQAQKLYSAFFHDNPHFFYVGNTFGLEGYERNGTPYYNKMLLAYTMNAAERATAKQQLDTVIQNIIEQAPDDSDDFETELYLHEQLTMRCTYDHDTATKGYDYNPHAYTIFGALVNGKAVCEGYSRAMQLLLKNVDIPSTLVVGKSAASGEQHMWNMVTINGQNYHLDATWNDTNDNNRHNYFNVTTQQISISHRIETDQLGIDTCTATTDNYYVKQGLYLDTYRRQEIAAVIAERIRNGDTQIELFFAADKFDSALLFLKSRSTTEAMVNAHLANSTLTLWEYTLYGETDEHILYMKKQQ